MMNDDTITKSINEPGTPSLGSLTPASINEPPAPTAPTPPVTEPPPTHGHLPTDPDELEDEIEQEIEDGDIVELHPPRPKKRRR